MALPRPILANPADKPSSADMAEPIVADVSASATTREPLKPAPVIDRYALLRLRQAQGGRGSQMVDFLSARSRANSALMSSQF